MTHHSDIVIHIDEIHLIGKVPVIDQRPWITRIRDWLTYTPYVPCYSITYKFFIQESPYVHAGWKILTYGGRKWFIMARSLRSLICEPVEDMTEQEMKDMEDYRGVAIVYSEGREEDEV